MSRVVADLVCRSLLCFGMAATIAGFVRNNGLQASVDADREPACSAAASLPAAFGAYDDMGDLVPTTVIPLVPGQEFGWQVRVNDTGLHHWKEILVTPAAPREWVGADLKLTDDGRIGVTERDDVAEQGFLEHAWKVTEGDPAGQHELHVYVDEQLVQVFRFTIR